MPSRLLYPGFYEFKGFLENLDLRTGVLMAKDPPFWPAKLGEKGNIWIPRAVLRRLGLEGEETTLYFFVGSGRIIVLTQEEMERRLAGIEEA